MAHDNVIPMPGTQMPPSAGAAVAPAPQPVQLSRQLKTIDKDVRTAVGRLTAMMPTGAISEEQYTGLFSTYSTIQANIADMAEQISSVTPEGAMAVQKDLNEVQTQAQGFIEAVEAALGNANAAAAANPAATSVVPMRAPMQQRTKLLMFALALGVGAVAWGAWQMQKEKS